MNNQLIAIEFKCLKGGYPTPAQISRIETLKNNAIPAKICYGADEVKEFVRGFSYRDLKKDRRLKAYAC